jgi:hypothetical protein
MKVRLSGVFVVSLIALVFGVPSVWSQETTQPAVQDTAQPGMAQEATPPAAQDTAQPGMTQEAAQQPAAQPAVKLAEAVVCQDVVDRAPVGSGDVFAKEVPKVYCFTRVVGAEGSQLTHNWYYKGTLKASVKLNVRSSNYRTWSSKTMMPEWTGEWMVEILSAEGKPLESIIFILK